MRFLRLSLLPLVAVVVGASSCGQEDDAPSPSEGARAGASGHANGGSGGTNHGGAAGANEGGSSGAAEAGMSGQSAGSGGAHHGGTGGAAGAVEFGCTTTSCSEATLAGSCPAERPEIGGPCTELGATCIYCFDSPACPGETMGSITQCCPSGWEHNCYNQCENPGPSSSSGGEGGQGGAGGQQGAEIGGAGGVTGSCADLLTICCNANADCPDGFECANEPEGLDISFGYAGTCRARQADTSRCWVNADCPADYRCDGALYCGCGYQCNDEFPGSCTPL